MTDSSAPLPNSISLFSQDSSRACAARAVYVHLYMAMRLGYYISPTESTLFPTQSMVHLGFGIDSKTSSWLDHGQVSDNVRKV